jgi:transcriptional regulator with PAS, ATPase and Fis domain
MAIESAKQKLGKAALTNSTVLIRGESGTGKELFAHSVHSASNRALRPFIAINCSAIPETLLESELFGYDEGAFTGAKKGGKPGKFELARGGTIFLDEIGDMPLHLQSKLLRVLESGSMERVGGTEPITVDVRIIAATHRNLEEMIERREFREDLYYRLSVIPVFIPSLRERPEDIPVLIAHFLSTYCKKLERDLKELDQQTRAILINYPWPGNVRELQNTLEYAINMSELGQLITVEQLPQRILTISDEKYHQDQPSENLSEYEANPSPGSLKAIGKSLEIETILETLKRFGNNTTGKKKAAGYLGVSLTTLYRRLKENY